MTEPKKPKTKLQALPGESVWETMARELATNPDSVPSLNILSTVSKAMKPRTQAVDQVVAALVDQLREDGEPQRAAVQAAIQYWERECGTNMDSALLDDLRKTAREHIEHKRRQPPKLESILSSCPTTTDTGYQLGIHLDGLQGTWHRLWGIISITYGFGDDVDANESVADVRSQFESLLGRSMSASEWSALVAHAKNHHDTVAKPALSKRSSDK